MEKDREVRDLAPIIGLAGGIGSGKSAAAKILRDLGCAVSDSDEAARAALRDPDILAELISWWGRDILDKEGGIDRSKVAGIVFADANERKRLEMLTHPWIEKRRKAYFASVGLEARALVIDAPLLFEAGVDSVCDAVIFVYTMPEMRLRRVREARGWDEAMLRQREDSQLPLDEKRNRADYVVSNNDDLDGLRNQLNQILDRIAPPAV